MGRLSCGCSSKVCIKNADRLEKSCCTMSLLLLSGRLIAVTKNHKLCIAASSILMPAFSLTDATYARHADIEPFAAEIGDLQLVQCVARAGKIWLLIRLYLYFSIVSTLLGLAEAYPDKEGRLSC